jgi:nitric oxide reductase activation protein
MSNALSHATTLVRDDLPAELVELWERVQSQPDEVRAELEPLVADAVEQARFRGRVMTVARDALERLKLDLEMARFDLDATRREREDLRRLLESQLPEDDSNLPL